MPPSEPLVADALFDRVAAPTRETYLTSGATRRLKLGAQTIELGHAPRWQVSLPGHAAGAAIRALHWLDPEYRAGAIVQLSKILPAGAVEQLLDARARLPNWLARDVSVLAAHA